MSNLLGSALRGARDRAVRSVSSSLTRNIGNTLSKYRIGGVGLDTVLGSQVRDSVRGISGSLLSGGGVSAAGPAETFPGDPLIESAFRVSFPLLPELEMAHVREITVNPVSFEYDQQRVQGLSKYYVKAVNYPDLSIVFNEDSNAIVSKSYHRLASRVFDEETGVYGLPADYKQDIEALIVDHQGSPVLRIIHKNCSPVSLSSYAMSVSGAKMINPVMSFKVEKVIVESGDGSPFKLGSSGLSGSSGGSSSVFGNLAGSVARRALGRLGI